jgi:hypothetical protein
MFEQDGFVFWVKTGDSVEVSGSLHHAIDQQQNVDETIAKNRMIFTALSEVSKFNELDSQSLLVGSWETNDTTLKVVFSLTSPNYRQAELWHYQGDAVYPALESQFVDSEDDLPTGPIVSNSLPIWLSQNSFAPVYPSFLVPSNVAPPYIVADIPPGATTALAHAPTINWPGTVVGENLYQLSSTQLMQDRVELTLYGFTSEQAQKYLMSLMDYSLLSDTFGFANDPAPIDEKRTQSEISAIAMKKTIVIMANYLRNTPDAVARRLLLNTTVNYTI